MTEPVFPAAFSEDAETAPSGVAEGPFPEILRGTRTRAGLTQQALADLSTVSPRTIRGIETGRTNARVQTVNLLADALRLQGPIRDLFVQAGLRRPPARPFGTGHPAIPRCVNDLVGREQEVQAFVARLQSGHRRMVCLVGLAGVGKTRLAAEIAARLYPARGWPVLWMGAAPGGAVPGTDAEPLVRALRASLEPDPDGLARVRRLVGRHEALLVLDGLADVCCPTGVEDLLAACPGLRVVSTSRAPWPVRGVEAAVVPPLATPGPEWDAEGSVEALAQLASVRLLVERFSELAPDFVLDGSNAADTAKLVRRLDGLPLALEAMAGRFRVLGLAGLAELPVPDLLAVPVPVRAAAAPTTIGGLLESCVARLAASYRVLLGELARHDEPWTAADAAAALRRPLDRVLDDLDVLVARGMVIATRCGRSTSLRLPNLLRALLLRQEAA